MGPAVFSNANFPLDAEGRTYHVGTTQGETANLILTVGDSTRAELIASMHFDKDAPQTIVQSKRGFLTITGKYQGVPVSIVAIGMGISMMDFFVREVRAVVDGPMKIIRFGSCGSITDKASVGQLAVATRALMVNRNWDHFTGPYKTGTPYLFSSPVDADKSLTDSLLQSLESVFGPDNVTSGLNATADSFYSSQGRLGPYFFDENSSVIDHILEKHPDAVTLEMETGMLFHLAKCTAEKPGNSIQAAATTMVFADRKGGGFVTPDEVKRMESLGGKACLDALIRT